MARFAKFAAIALALCAVPEAGTAAQPGATVSATARVVAEPPAGLGQVVFFRRASIIGMPYWTNVRENGAPHGKLTNGSWFVQALEPGVHTFDTSVLGKDSMRMEIDPGETYYVEGKITLALLGYTIIMTPSDAGTFQRMLKGMKPAQVEAPAR